MQEKSSEIKTPKHLVFIIPPRPKSLAEMLKPVVDGIEIYRPSGRARAMPPAWCDAMRAAGYAVWQTPSTIYVFVGE